MNNWTMSLFSNIDKKNYQMKDNFVGFHLMRVKMTSHIKRTNYFKIQPFTVVNLKTVVLTSKTTSWRVSCSTLSILLWQICIPIGIPVLKTCIYSYCRHLQSDAWQGSVWRQQPALALQPSVGRLWDIQLWWLPG